MATGRTRHGTSDRQCDRLLGQRLCAAGQSRRDRRARNPYSGRRSGKHPPENHQHPATEFAQTPKLFGGLVAGTSGIYTDIPTGTRIFRELSPYVGNAVYLELSNGLAPLPTDYSPRPNDTLDIIVQRPANPLREVVFENKTGGKVTATYVDGTTQAVTTVLKPVLA